MKASSIHPVFLIAGIFVFLFSVKLAILLFAIDYVAFLVEKYFKKKRNKVEDEK